MSPASISIFRREADSSVARRSTSIERMYLIDTNVISELRRPRPHGAVIGWFSSVGESDLYIAAITIGEIQAGIERTREQNAEKAAEFDIWLAKILQTFAVIPMDAKMFRLWAKLMHRKSGELYEDAMI